MLPGGDLFIAGPQKPARRFNWTVTPVVDDPAKQFNQVFSQRGSNMDGTAVLLPLRPPDYEPRVLIAGGNGADTLQSAEWIDLSAGAPAWQALPNMNAGRNKVNSVLLPDGTGGHRRRRGREGRTAARSKRSTPKTRGRLLRSARRCNTRAATIRRRILLSDGSVLVGGDPGGDITPHERYLPPYFFKARPTITERRPPSHTAPISRSTRLKRATSPRSC